MGANEIKKQLGHPILDGDGHVIEYLPTLRDFIVEEAGQSTGEKFDGLAVAQAKIAALTESERRDTRLTKPGFWGLPSENTLDRASALLPGLLYERLDEIGIDYAILYPTFGLMPSSIYDDELRIALARACNRYSSEVLFDHRDRLEPVATIPMRTPEEAVAELEFAIGERGLKAIVMAGVVLRPLKGAENVPRAVWPDTVGHDSIYDYDPVWEKCVELGVAPTFHTIGWGWGSRASTSNFVFNHIGHFAAAQEAICRSIVMGGVAARFPELRFSFLEGGVAWAANLCSDLISHFEKRNKDAVQTYNPAKLDRGLFTSLVEKYGHPAVTRRLDQLDYSLDNILGHEEVSPEDLDEFAASGVKSTTDIVDLFTDRFFFGCEADDPMTAIAFDPSLPPRGKELQPIFASDIGHFDVRDAMDVLPEAWELVEHGHLDNEQFKRFTFTNAVKLWSAQNPGFFNGTVIEGDVAKLS